MQRDKVRHELAEHGEPLQAPAALDALEVGASAVRKAEELDAVARALQQGQHLGKLRDAGAGFRDRLVVELDHPVAQPHAAFRHVERDPVVRQARTREDQMPGLELSDPVAHECLAGGRDDEVELVLVVVVPTRERRREAMVQAADEAHVLGRLVAERWHTGGFQLELGLSTSGQETLMGGHGRTPACSQLSGF